MQIPGSFKTDTTWRTTVPGFTTRSIAVGDDEVVAVTLDGITLTSVWSGIDITRQLTDLQGWWSGADLRVESMLRPGMNGGQEGRILEGARPLAVSASIYTQTRAEMFTELERFGNILAGGTSYGTLQVVEPERGLSRQVRVHLTQTPTVKVTGMHSMTATWLLRAEDPIRYDTAGQAVVITRGGADRAIQNIGNTAVPLLVTLRGPLVTPSIWMDGVEWRLNQTIAAGETVRATWSDTEVMKGSNSLAFYQAGPWKWLDPGTSQVGFFAVSGTGSATIEWRSGWR